MANTDMFLGLAEADVNKAVSWLEDARHMPATSGFSPTQWLWHWLSSTPAFAPLTEAAEKMDTVFGFTSGDWAFHWVEEMEKASLNPGPAASPVTPAQPALDSNWPHFPNGHRSLGLAPADLLRAHAWWEEAASFDGAMGWKEDDARQGGWPWLEHWPMALALGVAGRQTSAATGSSFGHCATCCYRHGSQRLSAQPAQ
ncbi:unnamed protein product [Symbiodinium natans]|uniref:Uncharacterized protein n=1 Tax=Symbiodinium natans TaxID=878477 RepID=A0A812S576_9DINO|nr:unnamed protein product [Symbiodinium natans]